MNFDEYYNAFATVLTVPMYLMIFGTELIRSFFTKQLDTVSYTMNNNKLSIEAFESGCNTNMYPNHNSRTVSGQADHVGDTKTVVFGDDLALKIVAE